MTGGENLVQREPGLAFRPQPATSPAPPPPAPVRRPSGVTTTDDFVIDHLHKLELAGGPGVATRLADSAHLQRLGKAISLSVERFVTVGEPIGEEGSVREPVRRETSRDL